MGKPRFKSMCTKVEYIAVYGFALDQWSLGGWTKKKHEGYRLWSQDREELVIAVRKNATIDWTVKESAKAKLRVIIRRLLRKYGYPPDKQEKATQTVLEQAELLCKEGAN